MSEFQILMGTCDGCGAKIRVKSRQAEKVIPCPKCSVAITATAPTGYAGNASARPHRSKSASSVDDNPEEGVKRRVRQLSPEPDEDEEPSATEMRPTLYALGALIVLLVVGAVVVDRLCDEPGRRAFLPLIFIATLYGAAGALIGAVTLRAAAKWVAGLDFAYWDAYLTVLLAYLITMSVAAPASMLIASEVTRRAGDLVLRYLFVLVQAPLLVVLISTRHRLTFAMGAKIVGVTLLIALAIGAVLGGFASLVFWMTSR